MSRLKPSRLTVYIMIAFILVGLLGIVAMQGTGDRTALENQALRDQIAELEQENLEYEYRIANLGSDESVEQLARERLHWVYDREIVYIDAGNE